MVKLSALIAISFCICVCLSFVSCGIIPGFRAPAVPLLVNNPSLSVWCTGNTLGSINTTHWSNKDMHLMGYLRIDGTPYRFLGGQVFQEPELPQVAVMTTPTETNYTFALNSVELIVTFLTPAFPSDIDELSRPYTYINFEIRNVDSSNAHTVSLYFDQSINFVVDNLDDNIAYSDVSSDFGSNCTVLTMGSYDQIYFGLRGDYIKQNWGNYYLATASKPSQSTQAYGYWSRYHFLNNMELPPHDQRQPRAASDDTIVSAMQWDFGSIASFGVSSATVLIALDDIVSMDFFHDQQIPNWRQIYNNNVAAMITEGLESFASTLSKSMQYDLSLIDQLSAASNSDEYITVSSLVHRQVTGALLVTYSSKTQSTQVYMKEISSDGDISTVDVIYPASPFLLLLAPETLRLTLMPLLRYSNNETDIHYNLPWAVHHLGIWPVCDLTGQEQEQMPMEESGNLLLMLAGIASEQHNVEYLAPYWNVLQTWAEYLNSSLPNPGDQLCTDDFEGPSPENVNLALKGILGLGAYSQLLQENGQSAESTLWMNQALEYVQYWLNDGINPDNTHFKLQYNLNETWSMKYNLVFQNYLGLNIFPASVAQLESAYYNKQLLPFGPPLDSRSDWTKADWMSWVATFSDSTQANDIWLALYNYANTTPSRVPISDWFHASTGVMQGFQARPVMGGVYMQTLNFLKSFKSVDVQNM